MAHRGYTSDPNAEARRSPSSYECLPVALTEAGYNTDPNAPVLSRPKPQKPLPRKWLIDQYSDTVSEQLPPNGDIGQLFDNEFYHVCPDFVPGAPVDRVINTMRVINTPVQYVGVEEEVLADLGIDSDGEPITKTGIIDPNELNIWDDWFFNDPIFKPYTWDGGSFANQGEGYLIDGMLYRSVGEYEDMVLIAETTVTFADGAILAADGYGETDVAPWIQVTKDGSSGGCWTAEDIVGRLVYDVIDCVAVITDWTHCGWENNTPVKRAFRVMLSQLPQSVTNIYVPAPSTSYLWTSLGFQPLEGNDQMLIYTPPLYS